MSGISETVLEQLEMVRMQGRFNMTDKKGVQIAAGQLGCSELICFIEDVERGGWMSVLNALGDFTNAMSGARRDVLRAAVDAAVEEDEWDD